MGNATDESFVVLDRNPPPNQDMDGIVAYLRREFGEFAGDPDALSETDLVFHGTLQFPHRIEHIWKFPLASEHGGWLRVTERGAIVTTDWSPQPPPGV